MNKIVDEFQRFAGKPFPAGTLVNCLSCARFSYCHDENKRYDYACTSFLFPSVSQGLFSLDDVESSRDALEELDAINQKVLVGPNGRTMYPDNYDIVGMVEEILSQDTQLPVDMSVDDRDMPEAKNFYEFVAGRKFLNSTPYPVQLWIGLELFNDVCPNPKCSDIEWWRQQPMIPVDTSYTEILEKVTLLEHGKCPKCKQGRADFLAEKLQKPYTTFAGLVGQRGGKSQTDGFIKSYQTHKMLKVPNPPLFYGLLETSELHGTIVALSFGQAKENVYDPLRNLIDDAPWFKEYHKMLDHYGDKADEPLYAVKETFFAYKHRNFGLYPAGPDKRKLRGKTRWAGSIDELGWFLTNQGNSIKFNVKEIYAAMNNSFKNMRTGYRRLLKQGYHNAVPPIFVNISSPSSKGDKITEVVEAAKRKRNILGVHLSTWEMNPNETEASCREDAETESDFLRDFAAIPPHSAKPYIDNIDDVAGVLDLNRPNAVTIQQFHTVSKSGKRVTSAKVIRQNHVDKNVPKIMVIDAGEINNSFAFCIGHNDLQGEKFVPIIDAVGEIIPSDTSPINFSMLYSDLFVPLCKMLNVTLVVGDRWQSTKLIQDLEREVENMQEAIIYSVAYHDFSYLREELLAVKFRLPQPEMPLKTIETKGDVNYPDAFMGKPVAHLCHQFVTVQDWKKTVEKGEGKTDDLLRTLCGVHSFLTDEDYARMFSGHTLVKSVPRDVVALSTSSGNVSGGSGAVATGMGGALNGVAVRGVNSGLSPGGGNPVASRGMMGR